MPRTRAFFGRKTSFKVKLKKTTINSITAVLLFAIAGLIWLSFTKQGSLLSTLYTLLTTQFGILTTFFLPFPFIVGGLMLTKIRSSLAEPHVFVGSFVILAALSGLSRGGKLGFQLWQGSSTFLSSPGAALFLLTGLFIGVIIMLNIPFEDALAFFVKLFTRFKNFLSRFKKISEKTSALPQRVIKFSGMASSNTPPPPQQKLPLTPAFPASSFRPSPSATDSPGISTPVPPL